MTTDIDPRQLDPHTPLPESTELERQLAGLIRRYAQHRSLALAHQVVSHIEALRQHPDYDGDTEQRCVYHRLARHWRWIAEMYSVTAQSPEQCAA